MADGERDVDTRAIRGRPSSNLYLRVRAGAPLLRTKIEFERFDRVGSQISSDPSHSGRHFGEPRERARLGLTFF